MRLRHYEVVISRKRRLRAASESYDFKVKAKLRPESIIEYLDPLTVEPERRNKNDLLDNARKHLSAIGWKFWSKIRNGNDEWRYESPRGRTYYSLNTACEAIARGKESNSKDGFDDNVGGFTGLGKRKRKKMKRRRVSECFNSDDDEVVRRRRGFRGDLEASSSENEGESSDGEFLVSRFSRIKTRGSKRRGVWGSNVDVLSSENEEGLGCRRTSSFRGNVEEDLDVSEEKTDLLSESESDQEVLDRMSKRLRRGSGFTGNADDDLEVRKEKKEDIVYSRSLLSKNRLGKRDQDGLRCGVTRLESGGPLKGDGGEKVEWLTPLATRFDDEKSDDEDSDDEDSDDEDCPKRASFKVKSKKRTVKSCLDGQNMSRVLRSSKRVREIGSTSASYLSRTVLSWLIENNAVVPRSKVYYRKGNSTESLMEGRIARDGIRCGCCQGLFSLSEFQAHVVGYSIRRPAECIFLENGKSLMSCQVELMRERARGADTPVEQVKETKTVLSNDCVCTICQFGGSLILCDRCPSSFHADCLNLEGVPEGEWFCPTCCCAVCSISNDVDSLLRCYQCERRYHAHCRKGREVENPGEKWFCCSTCDKIQWGLQQLIGKPILVGQGNLTWTLRKSMPYDAEDLEYCDIVSVAENYSKLSVALEVMHECFEPVKDLRTKRDLIEDVVFCRGSNLNRLNFKGFYTVLLEKNDELIATALLRIYGEKVAEVPLIGTRVQHRRLGMCRVLMNGIEKNLLELGVQKLVLPAAPSVLNTWTTSFGFSTIEEPDRSQFLGYTFLDFRDTKMCQKLLSKPPVSRSHLSRDMSSVQCQPRKNVEGRSIVVYNEGNSSISEVFHEEQHQVSDSVDQGAELNDAASPTEFMDQRRVERDKNSLKFYIRKQDIKPQQPLVSQTNYSKLERLEVRCR